METPALDPRPESYGHAAAVQRILEAAEARKPAWPNHDPKPVGQTVRAVHPHNAGRYPDGVVVMSDDPDDERASVTVQIGLGSTVYGPARHWAPIAPAAARLEWLDLEQETLAMLERAGVPPERLDAMRRTAAAIRRAVGT